MRKLNLKGAKLGDENERSGNVRSPSAWEKYRGRGSRHQTRPNNVVEVGMLPVLWM